MTPVAIAEVLGFRVGLLAELPVPCTLVCELPVVGRAHLTTSREQADALVAAGEVVLTPTEFEALTVALGDGGCLWREGALERIAQKRQDPRRRLGKRAFLGHVLRPDWGMFGEPWTVGQLLEALGGELLEVRVHAVADEADVGVDGAGEAGGGEHAAGQRGAA